MDDQRKDADETRRRAAEAGLQERSDRADRMTDPGDVARLLHELGVQQVELEMQNEQLRQTHAALEAARDRYRDLYERAPVGYVTATLEGQVLQANERAATLLGVPMAVLLQRQLPQLVVPDSWPALRSAMRRQQRRTRSPALEVAVHDGAGRPRWVGVEILLLHAEPDGAQQCRLALMDIDSQVGAREGLARLAAIVASSSEAIIGRDLAGRVTSWNAAAERLFGWSAAEMQGRTLEDLLPDGRRDEDEELQRRVRRGEATTGFETVRLHRDGSRLQVAVTLSPVLDEHGRTSGSSLTAADIGVRKRAERDQLKRLRKLDLVSQASHTLIMAGQGLPALRLVQQRLFESLSGVIGAEACLQFAVPARGAPLVATASNGVLHGSVDPQALAAAVAPLCQLALQRGSPRVVEDLSASSLDAVAELKRLGAVACACFPLIVEGEVDSVVAFVSGAHPRFGEGDLPVVQTVCDQVAATLARHRLVAQLHERESRLERADRAKDEFIATLAHELRNPLAPILNAAHFLRELTSADNADKRLAWSRDVIERQASLMARLLDDLLDAGRVSRNKVVLRRERMDLRQALHQALETAQPTLEAQRHHVTLTLPEQPVPVLGDLARLSQVFGNLLSNAAKYTDPGGHVEVTLQVREGDAEVFVRDDGIGIDPPQLARVFDMFAQLTPALERSRGGLGIGLALTRALVELHGGRIEAESAGRGRGSTFRLQLPLAEDAAEAAPPPAAATPAPDAGAAPVLRRVLVVDDNVDAGESLAAAVALGGHEVQVAHGGRQGLEIAAQWRPDVAVVDIGMPDVNGYEFCRIARAEPWGACMRLIACTGWGMDEDRQRVRAAGFDHHLVKPADIDALEALIVQDLPA